MILNSPVLETTISNLINTPKAAAKGVADLAETLIGINKVTWNIQLSKNFTEGNTATILPIAAVSESVSKPNGYSTKSNTS